MKAEFALQRLHTVLQDLYWEGFVLSGEIHLTQPKVKGLVISQMEAAVLKQDGGESVYAKIWTQRSGSLPKVRLGEDTPPSPETVITAAAIAEKPPLQPHSVIDSMAAGSQADSPTCMTCGHLTVRSGSCYKCLNCGASLGCS